MLRLKLFTTHSVTKSHRQPPTPLPSPQPPPFGPCRHDGPGVEGLPRPPGPSRHGEGGSAPRDPPSRRPWTAHPTLPGGCVRPPSGVRCRILFCRFWAASTLLRAARGQGQPQVVVRGLCQPARSAMRSAAACERTGERFSALDPPSRQPLPSRARQPLPPTPGSAQQGPSPERDTDHPLQTVLAGRRPFERVNLFRGQRYPQRAAAFPPLRN